MILDFVRKTIIDSKKLVAYLRWKSVKRFIKKNFIKRGEGARSVQRFVLVWILLFGLMLTILGNQFNSLEKYYIAEGTDRGGIFIEGISDEIKLINPIFPQNNSSDIATKLIFNGLVLRNGDGKIEPDLAHRWEQNKDGLEYKVFLREDVYWHDGEKFNSDDVVFTFRAIGDQDTNSPLYLNWKDIKVSSEGEYVVVFKLPNPYAPFPTLLNIGILPQHILGEVSPELLRRAEFNQRPIGTGPFEYTNFIIRRQEHILIANNRYYKSKVKLDKYVLKTYFSIAELRTGYENGEVMAVGGLTQKDSIGVEKLADTELLNIPLSSIYFMFLNNDNSILKDKKVRQALAHGISNRKIASGLEFKHIVANSPLLPEQLGYDSRIKQLQTDTIKANDILSNAGWKDSGGVREKDSQKLKLQIVTQNNDILPTIATILKNQLIEVGVDLEIILENNAMLQRDYIQTRKYDILLASINLGSDPDVYPFWHSSQIKHPGLNLSLYDSETADVALQDGRTKSSPRLRAAKYKTFQEEWREDVPAIALLRQNYFYVYRDKVTGINISNLVNPLDRTYNVDEWTVNTKPTLKRLLQ